MEIERNAEKVLIFLMQATLFLTTDSKLQLGILIASGNLQNIIELAAQLQHT